MKSEAERKPTAPSPTTSPLPSDVATVAERGREEGYEILLPSDRTYGDYLPRMTDLLGTPEVAEKRPQSTIVNDLLASTEDVIRLQLQNAAYKANQFSRLPLAGIRLHGH